MRPAFTLFLGVALLGSAAAARTASDDWKTWQPVGKPVSCLPVSMLGDDYVRDDRTIDFKMSGGKIYRQTLSDPCPQLGVEKAFSYAVHTDDLCSGDIITVLRTPFPQLPGASCALSPFQQVIPTQPAH